MARRIIAVLLLLLLGCGDADLVIEETDPAPELLTTPLSAGDPANGAVYAIDISMWEGPMSQYEMDCFYSAGVRHVVAGTQVAEVTRQQLSVARDRGMSIDAYVYLYWARDLREQVREAFARVQGFDIGRMWLDVEDDTNAAALGPDVLLAKVQEAVDECRLQTGAGCGLYTGKGYWDSYLGRSTRFADVPLWYARYNDITSLDSWSTERFGGWQRPAAKQWAERVLCNVGVDHNSMQVLKGPAVVVDRAPAPRPTGVPAAPGGLYPADGTRTTLSYLQLMSGTVPYATRYDLSLESWTGTAWQPYATWRTSAPFKRVSPAYRDRFFRLRARALNAYGWSPWSAYSTFEVGAATGPAPGGSPPPPPPPPPPVDPPPPPPPAGALVPDGATFAAGSAVTLYGPATAGATAYEHAIEFDSAGSWAPYFTYASASASRTFWPQGARAFRWRLRAKVNGTFGGWSSWATFTTR